MALLLSLLLAARRSRVRVICGTRTNLPRSAVTIWNACLRLLMANLHHGGNLDHDSSEKGGDHYKAIQYQLQKAMDKGTGTPMQSFFGAVHGAKEPQWTGGLPDMKHIKNTDDMPIGQIELNGPKFYKEKGYIEALKKEVEGKTFNY